MSWLQTVSLVQYLFIFLYTSSIHFFPNSTHISFGWKRNLLNSAQSYKSRFMAHTEAEKTRPFLAPDSPQPKSRHMRNHQAGARPLLGLSKLERDTRKPAMVLPTKSFPEHLTFQPIAKPVLRYPISSEHITSTTKSFAPINMF